MKHLLPLFILTGLLFGQDVLHLKSGELYTGTFYGKVGEEIVFKVEGETSTKKFSINDVEIIKIKSGELSYPFDVPKIANDIPITNERHETLKVLFGCAIITVVIFLMLSSISITSSGGGGSDDWVIGDIVVPSL